MTTALADLIEMGIAANSDFHGARSRGFDGAGEDEGDREADAKHSRAAERVHELVNEVGLVAVLGILRDAADSAASVHEGEPHMRATNRRLVEFSQAMANAITVTEGR